MEEKKLSEELRHCLEGDACGECQYHKPETKFICKGLLQKAYERVKEYEKMEDGRMKTHGLSNTKIYKVYLSMLNRCYKKYDEFYPDYGGRGITVCKEWREDFTSFYDWAMANGYRDDLTIDRIDNDKGYSPDNCRWATCKEQSCNKNSNKNLTYRGKTMTMAEWSDEIGISRSSLFGRLKRGWSVEKALSTPPIKEKRDKKCKK